MHGEDRLNIKTQLIIGALKLAEFPDHISIDYGVTSPIVDSYCLLYVGIAAVGFISFILPSIERRFGFSGKELGIIASSSDISALVLVVFTSYYGGFGNKIKWMGGGAILVGMSD